MQPKILTESAPLAQDPHSEAEMMHIAEYLKTTGYTDEKLAKLSADEKRHLMQKASLYASLKLAELEMGAAFVDTLHHDSKGTTVMAGPSSV